MYTQMQPPITTTLTHTKPTSTTVYYLTATTILSLLFIFHLSTSPSEPPFPLSSINLSAPSPPSLAYFISGSKGDSGRILRLLFSIYHPNNHYLLHLDLSAQNADRESLALTVQSTPLVTQDDFLHMLSYLPKDLNFVNHTSYIGWRESRRLKPMIVDSGLYLSQKSAMFYASKKRDLRDAYQLFTGSSTGIYSRELIEFSILGTENLARTLLMYLSDTPSSQSLYFPTLICNSQQFNQTIINHNLHYFISAFNARQEPHPLNFSDFVDLFRSGAAFASPFLLDDPVVDRIDHEILGRMPGTPVPGGWCLGKPGNEMCNQWGNAEVLRAGPGAKRLNKVLVELLSNGTNSRQCVAE